MASSEGENFLGPIEIAAFFRPIVTLRDLVILAKGTAKIAAIRATGKDERNPDRILLRGFFLDRVKSQGGQ
jgi:hypothetical protein